MVVVNSVSLDYFELNSIQYARIYQPLTQGLENIGIYSIFDTRLQLNNSVKYDEYLIDGVTYANQEDTVVALLGVIYSKDSGGGGVSNSIYNETPSGAVNGVNKDFTLLNTPIVGSVRVFLNGVRQVLGVHYTILSKVITFVEAPFVGDNVRVDYEI